MTGLGPRKVNPFLSQILENCADSDKKPYPGWIASAPVISPAAIIFGIFKICFIWINSRFDRIYPCK